MLLELVTCRSHEALAVRLLLSVWIHRTTPIHTLTRFVMLKLVVVLLLLLLIDGLVEGFSISLGLVLLLVHSVRIDSDFLIELLVNILDVVLHIYLVNFVGCVSEYLRVNIFVLLLVLLVELIKEAPKFLIALS